MALRDDYLAAGDDATLEFCAAPQYLPPPLDELQAWIRGEIAPMPLSDEEKARIQEIEQIRVAAWYAANREHQEALQQQAAPTPPLCQSCGRGLATYWRYCPDCGAPAVGGCPGCGLPRDMVVGARFCYQCGTRFQADEAQDS